MQFFNTNSLNMIKPTDAEPGTLLFSCAQYERAPILVFETAGTRYGLLFGEPRRFQLTNLPDAAMYFSATNFRIEVDMEFRNRISPKRDELPVGAVAAWDDTVAIVAGSADEPRFISVEGHEVDGPNSVNHYVGFASWRASVPNGLDDYSIVHFEELIDT